MLKGCGPVGALRASEMHWRWFSACCQFYHLGELMHLQEARQKQSYKGSNQCEQNLICFYRITLLENQELFAVRESCNCFSCRLIKPQMKKIQKADVQWSCHTIWEWTPCFSFLYLHSQQNYFLCTFHIHKWIPLPDSVIPVVSSCTRHAGIKHNKHLMPNQWDIAPTWSLLLPLKMSLKLQNLQTLQQRENP